MAAVLETIIWLVFLPLLLAAAFVWLFVYAAWWVVGWFQDE